MQKNKKLEEEMELFLMPVEALKVAGFEDGDTVPRWASREMSWAVAAGLINGSTSGTSLYLAPSEYATRAQVAAIVQRFVTFVESQNAQAVFGEISANTAAESTNFAS